MFLHEHFFGLVPGARYFTTNDVVYRLSTPQTAIGLAFYRFDFDELHDVIVHARNWTDRLIVYIAEPYHDQMLITLLRRFESDTGIQFFGDGMLNVSCSNWRPAICWFVTPRHYYRDDAWAQAWLRQVDQSIKAKQFQFDCLLGIPRPNRDAVESFYLDSAHKQDILYSYHKNNIQDGIWGWDIGSATGSWQSITIADQYQVALSALVPYDIYNQSWHSIVAESTDYNDINHMTEKVAKPIIAERVFVVFAGQYYLRNLRQLGFETFASVIDEQYDLEPDPARRYHMAWQQVESLCKQNAVAVRARVRTILEHNRRLFLDTDWQQELRQCLIKATSG